MRLFPAELALLVIRGELLDDEPACMTVEDAWDTLRRASPVDYGDNVEKWAKWVDQEFTSLRRAAIYSKDEQKSPQDLETDRKR